MASYTRICLFNYLAQKYNWLHSYTIELVFLRRFADKRDQRRHLSEPRYFEDFDSQERNPEDEYVSEVDEENLNDPEAPDSITWTDSAIRILLRIVSKNDAEAPNSRIPSANLELQNLDTVFQERIDGKEGVAQYKKLVRRRSIGILTTTISPNGQIVREYENVKGSGHFKVLSEGFDK
ncbi:hypothetical protein BDF21DRAFT_396926 [Thamnidium elegans]|nr:hypothetical protein BDF21DRAFT_396926 [Thamnidium elegans]